MSLLELGKQWAEEAEEYKRTPPEAKWFPDPTARHESRYWDGYGWSQAVADEGREGVDPIDLGPSSTQWLERFMNATLVAQREAALAARIGIPTEEYRAVTKTMFVDPEGHPEKVAAHYAELVTQPDDGWVEHAGRALRWLYNARLEAGTATALAWCKRCEGVMDAVPEDPPEPVKYHCSSCGHGVKHVRVVSADDAPQARADASNHREWSKAVTDAWRKREIRPEAYKRAVEQWQGRFVQTLGEVRRREEAFAYHFHYKTS